MLRAALLVSFLAGFAPTGEPVLVTTGKPVRTHQVTTDRAPAAFASLAQQGWSAIWDRDTGAPTRIFGSHLDVPGSVADGAIAEAAAWSFIAAHRDLYAGDFTVVANQVDSHGLRTVGFEQRYRGLRVIGGQLGFVFSHDRLFVISSEALPDVAVPLVASHFDPARVAKWLGAPAKPTGERAVLPLIRTGSIEYVLVDIADSDAQRVYVDPTGAPIARTSRRQYDGTLALNAAVRYPTSTRMDYPAREMNITANGSPLQTATDGTFAFTGGSATVRPALLGARAMINNQAGAVATTMLTVPSGGSATWNAMDDAAVDAQVSTFVYINLIKVRDREINPDLGAFLDKVQVAYDNENDVCNAYADMADTLHFFKASSQCENTGRISDIVFHEFGHLFHEHNVIAGMGAFPGTMSEGFADFNAANYTEDSGIARGFDYTDNPGREIDPVGSEASYPHNVSVDPHESGKIISGALWDLRKAAILSLGHDAGVRLVEDIYVGVMARSADFPTTYNSALIADDDDGDLGNGTPHQCMIAAAFAPHGLVANFETTTVGTPTLTGMNISVPVMRPTGGTCAPPAVKKATLTFAANGGTAQEVALTASGDNWVGAIPTQPDGTVVTYSVLVELDNGASFGFPDNLADPKYQLYVGPVQPIYCANMDTDPMWTQTNNKGSQWVWAPAGLDPTTTDPTTTHTGAKVYGTNLGSGGNYPANVMTSVVTGVIDTSKYAHVRLQYWRWLTVEQSVYDQATVEINGTSMWSNDDVNVFIDKEWRFQDLDLGSPASVQVGFTLASDDSQQYGGWTLDDVCLVGIKTPACGDGVVDSGEQCDDGNVADGDGCSSSCQTEDDMTMPTKTDGGGCCSAQRDPAGAGLLALGVALSLRKRRRARALKA